MWIGKGKIGKRRQQITELCSSFLVRYKSNWFIFHAWITWFKVIFNSSYDRIQIIGLLNRIELWYLNHESDYPNNNINKSSKMTRALGVKSISNQMNYHLPKPRGSELPLWYPLNSGSLSVPQLLYITLLSDKRHSHTYKEIWQIYIIFLTVSIRL
jgi:hypothetical protein